MKRIELFEFGDLPWVPEVYHLTETDFLHYYYTHLDLYSPIYEKIESVLKATHHKNIIDLCSGAGGPVLGLRKFLDSNALPDIHITLTDIAPNLSTFSKLEAQFPEQITGCRESIDATKLPSHFKGMRTFFTSFHHFPNEMAAKKLLQDALDNDMPIGIFELSDRSIQSIVYALLSSMVLQLLLLPQLKPFSFAKLFFIYIVPLFPIMMAWDYLISCFRTYSPKELKKIISELNAPHYHWEVGKKAGWHGLYHVSYLIGYKKV